MTARKAYLAAVVAVLAALGTAVAGDGSVSMAEAIGALGSAAVAYGAVYFAPNASDADPTTSTPALTGDRGDIGVIEALLVVLLVVVVLLLLGVL